MQKIKVATILLLFLTMFSVLLVMAETYEYRCRLRDDYQRIETESGFTFAFPKPFSPNVIIYVALFFVLLIAWILLISARIKFSPKALAISLFCLILFAPSCMFTQTAYALDECKPFIRVRLLVLEESGFRSNPQNRISFLHSLEQANSLVDTSWYLGTGQIRDSFESAVGLHFDVVSWGQWNGGYDFDSIGFTSGMIWNGTRVDAMILLTTEELLFFRALASPSKSLVLFGNGMWALHYVIRHELTHLFYVPDCDGLCVMCRDGGAFWYGSGEILPICDWRCGECISMLNANKFRYTVTGDVSSGDYKVDMRDIGAWCYAYGANHGDANWLASVDIDGNRKIDMRDVGYITRNFGQHKIFP